MNKKFRLAALAAMILATICMLGSCLKMDMGIVVKNDGSYEFYSDVTMAKSTLSQLGMEEDDFYNQLMDSAKESSDEMETEKISTIEEGEEYIGLRLKATVKDKETLYEKVSKSGSGINIDYSEKEEGGKKTISIKVMNGDAEAKNNDMAEYIAQGMMTVSFKITVPNEITDTNGTLSEDKKTAEIDIIGLMAGTSSSAEIYVTYSTAGEFPWIIVIVIGGVIVLAVIISVICAAASKKKHEGETSVYVPEQPVQQIEAAPVQVQETAQNTVEEAAETTEQVVEAAAEAPAAKFCPKCGTKLDDGAKFCAGCGSKIE